MMTILQTFFFDHIDPEEVYDAYMSENKHSVFTSSECEISKSIGGQCTMYDGYIQARNLVLERGKVIEQQWMAQEDEWPEGHESVIRIVLESQKGGTLLTLTHSGVPDSLKDTLEKGWLTYYWEPMEEYFG